VPEAGIARAASVACFFGAGCGLATGIDERVNAFLQRLLSGACPYL
jgi:hypothetical protein